MKPIISIILVLIFTGAAFAQEFSAGWDNIPATFRGNNFEAIHRTLRINQEKNKKDKSETAAQYNERMSNPASVSLGGKLTAADTMVFIYQPPTSAKQPSLISYDADKGILTMKILVYPARASVKDGNGKKQQKDFSATEAVPGKLQEFGMYGISNGYGAHRDVLKYATFRYSLAVNNIKDFSNLEYSFPVSPVVAKQLKENLAVLYVVKLASPYFSINDFNVKPTMDKPSDIQSYHDILIGNVSDIWLFDISTGKVYLKAKPNN